MRLILLSLLFVVSLGLTAFSKPVTNNEDDVTVQLKLSTVKENVIRVMLTTSDTIKQKQTVYIYDPNGKRIWNEYVGKGTGFFRMFKLSDVESGEYIVEVKINKTKISKKIELKK
jgi:hypothetical protein